MALAQQDILAPPREIAPGLFWIFRCDVEVVDGQITHGYNSVYLLRGTERTVLIDAGQPKRWTAIEAQLEQALDGRPLDHLFPTHCEFVHAGNLPRLLDKYPGARAVGDLRCYHLYFPGYEDRLDAMGPGDEIDLGGVRLVFLKPIIYDLPDTLWAYAPEIETLFVSDGLAHEHHRPSACGQTTAEIAELPSVDNFARYNDRAFYWTRFASMNPFFRDMKQLLQDHPSRVIAPAHGPVITAHTADILTLAEAGMSAGAEV